MKKISILLALMMVLSTLTALSVSASPFHIIPNDDICMPEAAPTVDGVIDDADGYSSSAAFDYDTTATFWSHNAMTCEGKLYFAYSNDGLYFAASFVELSKVRTANQNGDLADYDGNTFCYSTGEDNLANGKYGFNGDIISLSLDPKGLLLKNGFENECAPGYNIGLFEDGTAKLARSRVNDEILSDDPANGVKVAAKVDDFDDEIKTGWTAEAFIPWTVIAKDIDAISLGAVKLDAADLAKLGCKFNAAVTYMDRFFDPEAGFVDNWGRLITVCERTSDGVPGQITSGDCIKAMGLKLINGKEVSVEYTDLPENAWFTEACKWCSDNGYMSGTGEGVFSPNTVLTRAQFVQILAKVEGADLVAVDYEPKFTDVPDGKWFSKAVTWAVGFGVTGGVGDGLFAPDANVTRAQLATFLRTYAEKKELDTSKTADITGYADVESVPAWARDSVAWAVNAGLISGTDATHLSSDTAATRAQTALIIKKLCENVLA